MTQNTEAQELVFKDGNRFWKQRNLIRRYKSILLKAGLPISIRLYDLRHTCATMLLTSGIHPKVVSERLGHASVAITLDIYSHVLPTLQEEASNVLDNMLFGKRHTIRT